MQFISNRKPDTTTLRREGAQRYQAALGSHALDCIKAAVSDLPRDKAGIRLKGVSALSPYLSIGGPVGAIAGRC
jgi:hypothetical protein